MSLKFPINSEVIGLGDVLSEKYRIPVYQRPYEWEEKNIDDFLSSIFDGYKEKIEEKLKSKPVFFGTIQLNYENDEKNEKNKADIVDGQQRLTTFLLLLKTLQNEKTIIDFKDVIESEELMKALESGQEDDISDETSRYSINKKLLSKKIETYYAQEYAQEKDFYSDLTTYILENVYFVKLTTEKMELSDVVSVFNTINTTGLELNASDVFKFRYYDFLRRQNPGDNTPWMEKINECYKYIDDNNNDPNRSDRSVLKMYWVLDIYKHIICAQFGWGFSEVSKSNEKFFDDLFKENKYGKEKVPPVLEFDSFERIVKGFVDYRRWIEDARYNDTHHDIVQELFSELLVEKTRYSRYWTIPFVVAYFKAGKTGKEKINKEKIYKDSLKVNLYMFRFFTIYSVVNDKVINAVQNKVCGECFKWFKDDAVEGIIKKIKNMMWLPVRWKGDNPRSEFVNIIKSGLFYNDSRARLVCTLAAFLDEIEQCHPEDKQVSKCSIQDIQNRLFNGKENPYDIEHILARSIIKDNIDEFNGIGNLVVLDRRINRGIKDKPVGEKVAEYEKSIYVSVKNNLREKIKNSQEWNINAVRERQMEEVDKIMSFMDSKRE